MDHENVPDQLFIMLDEFSGFRDRPHPRQSDPGVVSDFIARLLAKLRRMLPAMSRVSCDVSCQGQQILSNVFVVYFLEPSLGSFHLAESEIAATDVLCEDPATHRVQRIESLSKTVQLGESGFEIVIKPGVVNRKQLGLSHLCWK